LVAICPNNFDKEFPSLLLVNKNVFLSYLACNSLEIFWTLLGEKQIVGMEHIHKGMMKINGLYYMKNGRIIGSMNAVFQKPMKRKEQKAMSTKENKSIPELSL
jgi:hypothetical protein